ncbi:hypothetical protein LCGC14_2556590, partial [marine sediment metagenome]
HFAGFDTLLVVDIIASGYEATCPECDYLCTLTEVPRPTTAIVCSECGEKFATDLPEHAIA